MAIVARQLEREALAIARSLGLPSFQYVVTSRILTDLPATEVEEEIDQVLGQILEKLTTTPESNSSRVQTKAGPAQAERFSGEDRYDCFSRMNEAFLERGWGDGFPLLPPTREAVASMLQGTSRTLDEVVAVMAPGDGMASVERIAINAVMAGCRAEHLPVLLAAVEAMTTPPFPLRTVACGTSPHAPLAVVNGPLAKRVGIHSGRCALGPGAPSRVNTAIGRALRLVMMNVGHAYPDVADLDTIGSPLKYGMCLAENEEANPWEPYHVERGFPREASTVTVFGIKDMVDMNDVQNETAEGLLTSYSAWSALMGGEYMELTKDFSEYHGIVLLAPDSARVIAHDGWSKKSIREYLYHHSRLPLKWLLSKIRAMGPQVMLPQYRWLLDAPQEMLFPVIGSPEWYHIVVAGGSVGKSQYMRLMGPASMTRPIEDIPRKNERA
ncbi:MAG: hypothetical protein HY323_06300 [Betaproteobacteria bacterium]|nr:hypothetical protein [Betaproteobacteria bacterium]MBI3936571.1 hypothetical protein [Betaproteobacteria bacterium]